MGATKIRKENSASLVIAEIIINNIANRKIDVHDFEEVYIEVDVASISLLTSSISLNLFPHSKQTHTVVLSEVIVVSVLLPQLPQSNPKGPKAIYPQQPLPAEYPPPVVSLENCVFVIICKFRDLHFGQHFFRLRSVTITLFSFFCSSA